MPQLPPYGICLPCTLREVRDGDTVVVSFPNSDRQWAVRLLDCWAPEVHGKEKPAGLKSKAFAENVLASADSLSLFIPAPKDGKHLLDVITFDRLLGYIYVSTTDTLNAIMVRTGHATKTKGG